MPSAAPSGQKAAGPNAVSSGRSTISTPAKARAVAPQTALGAFSPSTTAERMPVSIGLVNWIAVASASGIAITAMKKQIVASATAAPRPNWRSGRGMAKPRRP